MSNSSGTVQGAPGVKEGTLAQVVVTLEDGRPCLRSGEEVHELASMVPEVGAHRILEIGGITVKVERTSAVACGFQIAVTPQNGAHLRHTVAATPVAVVYIRPTRDENAPWNIMQNSPLMAGGDDPKRTVH